MGQKASSHRSLSDVTQMGRTRQQQMDSPQDPTMCPNRTQPARQKKWLGRRINPKPSIVAPSIRIMLPSLPVTVNLPDRFGTVLIRSFNRKATNVSSPWRDAVQALP